jgi:DNA primase large subunit
MDLEFAAKFPFTNEAKKIMDEKKPEISDGVIERALERVRYALKNGRVMASTPMSAEEKFEEILIYAASRMILAGINNPFLTNKYAVAWAKSAYERMSMEEARRIGEELGIKPVERKGGLFLPIEVYLRFSPDDVAYSLVNREVEEGYVKIKEREFLRIVQEGIKNRLESIPKGRVNDERIKRAGEVLKEFLPKIDRKITSAIKGDHPPCITSLLDQVYKHENLGHHARWSLSVYFLNRGVEPETILSLFSNLPDFSEKKTRYYIEHAKKRGYTMPSCETMRSYGLCVAECGIKNPLSWGRYGRKGKEVDKG